MGNPRRANGARRDAIRQWVLATKDTCWLCLQPVDKTLAETDPYCDGAPEVDEVIPVRRGGDPLDRGNCELAHRGCNRRKGDRILERGAFEVGRGAVRTVHTSRDW